MKNVVFYEILSKNRIRSTASNNINSNEVIGRQFGDLDSNIVQGRLPYPEAKLQLTKPRLDEEGFKLSDEDTPADGNCFLWALKDQMR